MAKWKKTCKNPDCRERFLPERPGQDCCGKIECAVVVGRMKRDKMNARMALAKKREERAKDEAKREELMTMTKRLDRCQDVVNKWIRLVRDKDEPCISCGQYREVYDAGHYRSVGATRVALRFLEDNIHKQCIPCNHHKGSNAIEYRINLVKKIGEARVLELEKTPPPFKPTIEWVEAIRADYAARLKAAGIKL